MFTPSGVNPQTQANAGGKSGCHRIGMPCPWPQFAAHRACEIGRHCFPRLREKPWSGFQSSGQGIGNRREFHPGGKPGVRHFSQTGRRRKNPPS